MGRSTFHEVWVRRSQSLMKHNNYNLLQEGVAATLHSNMLSAHFWKINDNIQIWLDTSVPPGGCSVSVGLKLQPNVGQFSPGHWDCQHGLDQTLQGPSVVLHRIVSRLFTNIKATLLQLRTRGWTDAIEDRRGLADRHYRKMISITKQLNFKDADSEKFYKKTPLTNT